MQKLQATVARQQDVFQSKLAEQQKQIVARRPQGRRLQCRVYLLQTTRWSENFTQEDCFAQANFRSEQCGDVCFEACRFGSWPSGRRVSFDRRFRNRRLLNLKRHRYFMNFECRRSRRRYGWRDDFLHPAQLFRCRTFSLSDVPFLSLFPR